MKRVLILAVAVLGISMAIAYAEVNYLNLGGDAVAPGRFNPEAGEVLKALPQDVLVDTVGGSGKSYRGYLRQGTEVVCIPSEKGLRAIRIYYCGNPILNQIYFQEVKSANREVRTVYEEAPQKVVYVEQPAQKSYESVSQQRQYAQEDVENGWYLIVDSADAGAGVKQQDWVRAARGATYAIGRAAETGNQITRGELLGIILGGIIGYNTTEKPKKVNYHYYYYNDYPSPQYHYGPSYPPGF